MRALAAVLAVACGCTCSSKPAGAPAPSPGGPGEATRSGAPQGPPLASKPFYRVDLAAPPACTAGAPCEVGLVLTALAGHKVNTEYPTKFVADASPECTVHQASFAATAKTKGVMKVQVTPAKAGELTLNGTFKLSVCTDDKCEIDAAKISLPITSS